MQSSPERHRTIAILMVAGGLIAEFVGLSMVSQQGKTGIALVVMTVGLALVIGAMIVYNSARR